VTRCAAGIDGGQSSTTAVVGDERGRILGRGVAGPADEVGQGPDSTRLRDALGAALSAALADAGLSPRTPLTAVVAGVSGYEGRVYGAVPAFPAEHQRLLHDAEIALAGAFAGGGGVVAIAGTGSAVYGGDGRSGRLRGGWGYLFGDEGSAFWIVRELLSTLMAASDFTTSESLRETSAAVCTYFGQASLRGVARAFAAGELTRERLASFAPQALGLAMAQPLIRRGGDALARRIAAAVADGAPPRAALIGGMFEDAGYRALVAELVAGPPHAVQIVEPVYEPAVGALLLAYRDAGWPETVPER
jgi:glucosamine kinase